MKRYQFKIVNADFGSLNSAGADGFYIVALDGSIAIMQREIEVDEVQHPDAVEEEPAEVIGCRCIEEVNKELMGLALKECGGNRRLAAERLGISERTLRKKIKEYNL